eukprot:TRINITY_DN4594_c0_g1_i1.p1 TRINITY_DN4594_c0_g1~~TRINITY_DN4594_c0_g1_i1.p1  ORF type:complete len:489 (-),score=141.63 TRINITY_DN4594_c0_g1_i1:70-1491(-)
MAAEVVEVPAAAAAAVSSAATCLALTTMPELPAVACGANRELLVMASLAAPAWKPNDRAPLDLVTVIDRSGSMGGVKLDLVKKTMHHVVAELKSFDRLSIVTFDDAISTELPLTTLDEAGCAAANRAIDALTSGNSTNLAGGIDAGLQQMRKSKQNDVASMIVFTDGMANVGFTADVDIVNQMYDSSYTPHTKVAKKPLPCTVNTFGYGSDHNPRTMKQIAEAGNGVFYYVENEEKITQSFANCVGGLLSVCAQGVTLKFEAVGGTQIKKILTGFEVKELVPNMCYELALADIQSEENRDVLISLQVPSMLEAAEVHAVLTVTVNYRDVIENRQETASCVCHIARPDQVPAGLQVNHKLDLQRNRLSAAEAMETATQLANQGHLEEARKTLTDAVNRIKESTTAGDPFCVNLVKDLEACRDGLQDQHAYTAYGHSTLTTCSAGHYRQRVTSYTHSGLSSYTTTSRVNTMSHFN